MECDVKDIFAELIELHRAAVLAKAGIKGEG